MESLLPPCKPIAQLPPIDARITPPPDRLAAPKDTTPVSMSDPARSDGASTPDSAPKGPGRKNSKSQSRDGPKPRSYDNNIVFAPRPYDTVCREQAYLTQLLNMQTAQAGKLARQFFVLEAQLPGMEPGKERQLVVKQQRHLKTKINKAIEQVKATYNRLGDLHIELNCRDSWTRANEQNPLSIHQVSLQRSYSADSSWNAGPPSLYTAISPTSYGTPTPTTPLNAMPSEFFPQRYFPWQPVEYQGGSTRSLETVEEAIEDGLYSPGTTVVYRNGDNENTHEDTEKDTPPPQRRVSCDTSVRVCKERRLSLPCLPTVWPEA